MSAESMTDEIQFQPSPLWPQIEKACWATGLTPTQFCEEAMKEFFALHPTPEAALGAVVRWNRRKRT